MLCWLFKGFRVWWDYSISSFIEKTVTQHINFSKHQTPFWIPDLVLHVVHPCVSLLQELEVGLLWAQTGTSGWRSTSGDAHKSPLLPRKVAMEAPIGWQPTCWCSVTRDTTGNSTDRRTTYGWVHTEFMLKTLIPQTVFSSQTNHLNSWMKLASHSLMQFFIHVVLCYLCVSLTHRVRLSAKDRTFSLFQWSWDEPGGETLTVRRVNLTSARHFLRHRTETSFSRLKSLLISHSA